jgi:hypothetical protein
LLFKETNKEKKEILHGDKQMRLSGNRTDALKNLNAHAWELQNMQLNTAVWLMTCHCEIVFLSSQGPWKLKQYQKLCKAIDIK